MKKAVFIVGSALCAVLLILTLSKLDFQKSAFSAECAFCDQKILEKQTVYQGNLCRILMTHKPIVAGHFLIVPERHVERFEDLREDELAEAHALIAKGHHLAHVIHQTTGYLLLQKNGKEAGQTVPHVHIHYIPRKVGESGLWLTVKLFIRPLLKPVSVQEIKEEITCLQST